MSRNEPVRVAPMTDAVTLQTLVDNMSEGVSMVDESLVAVAFNRRFLELLEFPPERFQPGDPFEKFIRFNAERGEYGPGDVEQLVRQKVALARRFEPHHIIRERSDGTVLSVRGNPVPGGGFVTTYMDITEQTRAEEALRENQSQLSGILDIAHDAVILVDSDHRIRHFNQGAERIFGYRTDEMIGEPLENLIPAQFRKIHRKHIADFTHGDAVSQIMNQRSEITGLRQDGTEFPAEASISKFQSKDGLIYSVMLRDVTANKRVEEALRDSEGLLRTTIDNWPAHIAVKDTEGRFLLVNEAFAESRFSSVDAVTGRTDNELALRPHADATVAQEQKVIKDREVVTEERHKVHQDGTSEQRIVTKFPIFDAGDRLSGIGTISTDITDLKQAELRLRGAIENMSGGFAIYDAEDKLAVWNDEFRRMRPELAGYLIPGTPYETILRTWVKTGKSIVAVGCEEAFIRSRLEERKNLPVVSEREFSDGRWLLVRDARTPDGGVCQLLTDITEQKRTEEALRKSEARLREILEKSPMGVAVVDYMPRGGEIVAKRLFANSALAEMFGFESLKDVIDGSISDSWVDRDSLQTANETMFQGGTLVDFEALRRRSDGTEWWVSMNSRPIRFDGRDCTMVWHFDITERKRTEAALQESQGRLIEAQRIAQLGSWELDFVTGTFTGSDELYRMFGVDPACFGASYEAFLDVVHPDDRQMVGKAYEDSLANGTPYQVIHRIQMPDGRVKWIQERCETNFDPDGKPVKSSGTAQDITERIEVEDSLSQALVVAEEANQAKSDFLATMSHELRTPLNAILGFSDILSCELFGPIDEPRYVDYARDIEQSGRYLLGLINDILDISKIEAGEYVLDKSFFDLSEVVDDCLNLVGQKISAKNIHLDTKFSEGLPLLHADKRAVKQILLNLLSNALKFTPEGGTIALTSEASNTRYVITISDTGPGIPEDEIGLVIEPFRVSRADPHVNSGEGSGLGLAITNSLVRLHRGTLEIDVGADGGTTVSVRFPNG